MFLSFNRTIVELKFETGGAIIAEEKPFNRTIVELKCQTVFRIIMCVCALLIVP